MSVSETATAVVNTIDPSWVAIAGLVLTFLIFPFGKFYFGRIEKQIEETKQTVGKHSETLVLHEYRIFRLEQPGSIPPSSMANAQSGGGVS